MSNLINEKRKKILFMFEVSPEVRNYKEYEKLSMQIFRTVFTECCTDFASFSPSSKKYEYDYDSMRAFFEKFIVDNTAVYDVIVAEGLCAYFLRLLGYAGNLVAINPVINPAGERDLSMKAAANYSCDIDYMRCSHADGESCRIYMLTSFKWQLEHPDCRQYDVLLDWKLCSGVDEMFSFDGDAVMLIWAILRDDTYIINQYSKMAEAADIIVGQRCVEDVYLGKIVRLKPDSVGVEITYMDMPVVMNMDCPSVACMGIGSYVKVVKIKSGGLRVVPWPLPFEIVKMNN